MAVSVPGKLLAYWDFEYQNLYFKIVDNQNRTVEVVSTVQRDGTVNVPASARYNDTEYRVAAIGRRAFADCKKLMAVTIEEGVGEIGHSAFRNCVNLISCTLPKSLRLIGMDAFMDCKNLRSISIGPNVGKIDVQAFYRCQNLEKLTIESGDCELEIHAFEGCKSLNTIILKTQETIRIKYSSFAGVPAGAEIFADKKCVSKIKKDKYWSQFTNIHTTK